MQNWIMSNFISTNPISAQVLRNCCITNRNAVDKGSRRNKFLHGNLIQVKRQTFQGRTIVASIQKEYRGTIGDLHQEKSVSTFHSCATFRERGAAETSDGAQYTQASR